MTAEQINALLHARIRDAADSKPPKNKEEWEERLRDDMPRLKQALGLSPDLPRTPLNHQVLRRNEREGFVHEIWQYESRPGLIVVAHAYLPLGEGKFPTIVQAHEVFPNQTREHWIQARGISLALAGFACILVTPPGAFEGLFEPVDRGSLGSPDRGDYASGMPWMGVYAWDLIRTADVVQADERLDVHKLGLLGDGVAGLASQFAFALEQRFTCFVSAFNAESFEFVDPAGANWNTVPGLAEIGDCADILGFRAPAPVHILGSNPKSTETPAGVKETVEKLQRVYRNFKSEDCLSTETIFGMPDLNRRARESVLAFFSQHLLGEGRRPYVAEARPLTDGCLNPSPNWTHEPSSMELHANASSSTTFNQFFEKAEIEAFPEDIRPADRLVPWGRYGRVDLPKSSNILKIQDAGGGEAADGVLIVPTSGIDIPATVHCGFALPEVYAQIIHLSFPGGPDGWESAAVGADALTSMIASVKTLIKSQSAPEDLVRVEADGPMASLTAHFLKLYRPALEIETSHSFKTWSDVSALQRPEFIIPQSRYMRIWQS